MNARGTRSAALALNSRVGVHGGERNYAYRFWNCRRHRDHADRGGGWYRPQRQFRSGPRGGYGAGGASEADLAGSAIVAPGTARPGEPAGRDSLAANRDSLAPGRPPP